MTFNTYFLNRLYGYMYCNLFIVYNLLLALLLGIIYLLTEAIFLH